MTFIYIARNAATGRRVTGRMEGESVRDVLARLSEAGYVTLSVRPATPWRDQDVRELLGMGRRGLAAKDRALFFRQMAALLKAGISLTAALESLAGQSRGRLREVTEGLSRSIDSGRSLHEAMAYHGAAFHPVHLALVRAAELSGTLDEVMERLAADEERRVRIEAKLRSAMSYPAFVLMVTLAVVMVMVTFIVPTFAGIFTQFDLPLPWPTRMWLAVASSRYVLLGLVGTGVSVLLAFWVWVRSPGGRARWDALKLRLPVLGPLLQTLILARVTRALATMYRSGLPMLEALEAAAALSGNSVFRTALAEARAGLEQGAGLAPSLGMTGAFPAVLVDMVAVGEATGALDDLLERAAGFYEDDAEHRLGSLTSLVEPILVVLMGGLIGFIAVSVFLPIFSLISGVSAVGG